ncbi:MAG: hypothetical protein HOI23_00895, partial [Deltaproteobacteria bacterium]|nr:hypothetical protein [Deltaproteobacteria bacterium]
LAVIVLTTTACAPFWQVNRIEDKVDRLIASTNRSTLSEIFGEQSENVMRKMESLSEEERYKLDQLLSEYEKGSGSLEEIVSVMGGGEREVASARGIWIRNEYGEKMKAISRSTKLKGCRRISEDDLPESISGKKSLLKYNWGKGTLKGETILFPWDLTISSFTKEIVENTAKRTAEEFIKMGGDKKFKRPIQIQITTSAQDGSVKISHDGDDNEIFVTSDKKPSEPAGDAPK